MKIIKALSIGIAPVILMSYGWALGQRHQSGYDVAGILLFVNGMLGLVLALILHRVAQKFSWHNKWYANALMGVVCSVIMFGLILLFAQLHS